MRAFLLVLLGLASCVRREKHPGTVEFVDKVESRVWTENAEAEPPGMAWARVGETWVPVVRIVLNGTDKFQEITKYGTGGRVLETTMLVR